MSPRLYAEIDGKPVPLDECDWVLWAACGCPRGVTVGWSSPTEDAAWKAFFDRKREIDAAKRKGLRLELVTHRRWSDEILALHMAPCPHQATGATA
jgi:hypothetical protein